MDVIDRRNHRGHEVSTKKHDMAKRKAGAWDETDSGIGNISVTTDR